MMCMYLHWPLKRLSPCCYPARPVPLAPVHRPACRESSHGESLIKDCRKAAACPLPDSESAPECHARAAPGQALWHWDCHRDPRARPPVGLHLVSHGVSAARTGFKTSSYGP